MSLPLIPYRSNTLPPEFLGAILALALPLPILDVGFAEMQRYSQSFEPTQGPNSDSPRKFSPILASLTATLR